MKILLVHNFYQQPGGEDQVFAAETELLRQHGHEVRTFTIHNDSVAGLGRLELARRTLWNEPMRDQIAALVRSEQPAVVHFHNTFPLISPGAYSAAAACGAAIVQTLHNFRLLCPNALLFREAQPCEKCLGRSVPWPGVLHKCYRDDRAASAVTAAMLVTHRLRGTWQREVHRYIALSDNSRQKFIAGGLPADRIVVKGNFVPDSAQPGDGLGGYALYVGRLSEEKGIATLLSAWRDMPVPLKIVGDGPLANDVRYAVGTGNAQWLGRVPAEQVMHLMRGAAMLVLPSVCYENFPRTIVEAYAVGTPVLASRRGAMAELVTEGQTGTLFAAGDPADLRAQALAMLSSPRRLQTMRLTARNRYLEAYTPEANYQQLMSIYAQAMAACAPRKAEQRLASAVLVDKGAVL